MGNRTNGAIPQRTRLRLLAALLAAAAATSGELSHGSGAYASGPAALTVYANQRTVRTSLHLLPGFALIVRADRRIDTVAVGDPRIVSAVPVRRGGDVFDVILQPLADTGTTNMIVWLGDVTTVWDLQVGSGPRTADVVFVVTQLAHTAGTAAGATGAAGSATADSAGTHGTPSAANAAGARDPQRAVAGAAAAVQPQSPAAPAAVPPSSSATPPAPAIELHETVGPVEALFRVRRTQSGILVRYEITNRSATDLVVKPAMILVRVDGHPAAYGMARESIDRARPDIVPRGATETGGIHVALPAARRIELTLSLLPVVPASNASTPSTSSDTNGPPGAHAGTAPSASIPFVLQATFSGLDRLTITPPP